MKMSTRLFMITSNTFDQGGADIYLEEQLKPELLDAACKESGLPLDLRIHDGYDHGYYFISTFIEEHLRFHSAELCRNG